MNNRPKLVILDTMNFWMDCALDILMDMIAKTDVITINDEEARQLSGEYSLVKAAKKSTLWVRICDHQKRRARSFTFP
jgi:sugar/nucleoside kinase (ribokinase family)